MLKCSIVGRAGLVPDRFSFLLHYQSLTLGTSSHVCRQSRLHFKAVFIVPELSSPSATSLAWEGKWSAPSACGGTMVKSSILALETDQVMSGWENSKVPSTQSLVYKGRQSFHMCKFKPISFCLGMCMAIVEAE